MFKEKSYGSEYHQYRFTVGICSIDLDFNIYMK